MWWSAWAGHCGDIALKAACATGSEIVVVPEVPWSVEEVASRLNKQIAKGNLPLDHRAGGGLLGIHGAV